MSSTISIITVCKNEAQSIRLTAESIAEQSFAGFEWIVKDGGSSDETVQILEGFRDHISILSSGPDGGIYEAMNAAAAQASGRWLLFMNGGDALAHRDALKNMLPHMSRGENEILLGEHLTRHDGEVCGVRKGFVGVLDKHHFYRNSINHQSCFIPRRIFDDFGPYDTRYRVLADYDLCVRAVLEGTVVRCVPELIAIYDMSGVSATMKETGGLAHELRAIRKLYPVSYRIRRWGSDLYCRIFR